MTDAAGPPGASGRATAPNGRPAATESTEPVESMAPPPSGPARPRTAAGSAPLPALGPAAAPSLPSPAALALARAPLRELERAVLRGHTPELDALTGWEFRGINVAPRGAPPIARLAGIQKFVKGMLRAEDGRVMGYNRRAVQNALDGRWQTLPGGAAAGRFGFYRVAPVDPTSRDNHYLHAVLLDYGKGGNARWDVTRVLRDYLVQVDAGDPDLLLGKAYAAVGAARVPLGYFVLERWRPVASPPLAVGR